MGSDAIGKPREWQKRYELVVTTDSRGYEHLKVEPLAELPDPPAVAVSEDQLVDLACRIYDTRRARARYFETSMFGEPVWDMLLALFCLQSRRTRLSVSGLSYAADVPQTTGLRWMRRLEKEGLIARTRDWRDGRRSFLHLTPKGEQLMRDYLSGIYGKLTAG